MIGKPAVPALIQALDDESEVVRGEAILALGMMGETTGEHAKDATLALIPALDDDSVDIRFDAAWTLGKIGERAKDAIPALREAELSDESEHVRKAAREALRNIDR